MLSRAIGRDRVIRKLAKENVPGGWSLRQGGAGSLSRMTFVTENKYFSALGFDDSIASIEAVKKLDYQEIIELHDRLKMRELIG